MNWVLYKHKKNFSLKLTRNSSRVFHKHLKKFWKVLHEPRAKSIVNEHTLKRRQKKLLEWVERIVDSFCEEQAIDETASFDNIKDHFHDDFHESFIYIVLTLLFKFLIDKDVAHIVEPRSDNDKKWITWWKQFIEEQEWKKFVNWWTPSLTKSKSGRRWQGLLIQLVGMTV